MLYDSLFQFIKEIILVAIWFVCNRIKMIAIDLYEYLKEKIFHRAHRFLAPDLWINQEDARCTTCKKRLRDCVNVSAKEKINAMNAMKATVAAICLLISIASADNFAGIKADSVFFRDSAYILRVAVTQSTCDTQNPCTMQVAGDVGSGAVLKNLFGVIGDTISIPYNFPDSQFAATTSRANLFFYGSDGKAKDIVTVRLGYKEVMPNALRATAPRFALPSRKWEGLINGRIFK